MTTPVNQFNNEEDKNDILSPQEADRLNQLTIDEVARVRELLGSQGFSQEDFNQEHNHDNENSSKIKAADIDWSEAINMINKQVKFIALSKLILNDLNIKTYSASVADDATITLPDATSGIGIVTSEGVESALFSWQTDGTPTLIANSTNVVTTDTDAKLCILDGGTAIGIKNRLGSAKTLKYLIIY